MKIVRKASCLPNSNPHSCLTRVVVVRRLRPQVPLPLVYRPVAAGPQALCLEELVVALRLLPVNTR